MQFVWWTLLVEWRTLPEEVISLTNGTVIAWLITVQALFRASAGPSPVSTLGRLSCQLRLASPPSPPLLCLQMVWSTLLTREISISWLWNTTWPLMMRTESFVFLTHQPVRSTYLTGTDSTSPPETSPPASHATPSSTARTPASANCPQSLTVRATRSCSCGITAML
ncbi:uncharacterized protein LOC124363217 [Homalodisca vitripennis]|uniref:uncharacterized protein LOC124363217 n=1 Tax=Homalodisca vitripennis TaxID=197043 RepID=UPI001EECF06F|nr:uncharacterized protein LOC124363217 [Homalodisca vitripennis]